MGPFKGKVPVFARLWPVRVTVRVSFTTGAIQSAILATAGLLVNICGRVNIMCIRKYLGLPFMGDIIESRKSRFMNRLLSFSCIKDGLFVANLLAKVWIVLFLVDRTIGQAFGTMCRLSSVCRLSVCNVLYCGQTVHPSEKVSEGVNRKPGSKSSFFGSPPYFYFRFRCYGHCDGRFCLIFAPIARQSIPDGTN